MPKRDLTRTKDGSRIVADTRIAPAGGQGEVWRASLDQRVVAVKLYHRHTATPSQRNAIERLVEKGPPAHCFLWPLEMVEDEGHDTFGYIMELREPRFRALEDFMARRIVPSMRALLTAGLQLSDGFLRLHAKGLCYRDISFSNVFFDPTTGEVRICDNDNVDISGTEIGGVLGTQRFMAPEIVRREAVPTDQSDRYSLAVLLFFLLFGGHPLDGAREAKIRCLDVPALEKLYGFEPLYVWDPDDDSNRPVPGIHDNPIAFKSMYPSGLAELFLRSFTEGLRYPPRRVRESEWRKAFARSIDSIWLCRCGAENFYDVKTEGTPTQRSCWSCKQLLALPPRLHIGDDVILLNRSTRLFRYHLDRTWDEDKPVAEVVPNPSNPAVFGLRNLSSEAWTLSRSDGSIVDVGPGKAAPIMKGNKINFGPITGEIIV